MNTLNVNFKTLSALYTYDPLTCVFLNASNALEEEIPSGLYLILNDYDEHTVKVAELETGCIYSADKFSEPANVFDSELTLTEV